MTRDLTKGQPAKLILNFTLPLLLGNVFQQFYNMVDSITVGRFVGKNALAAVSAASPIMFLLIAIILGLSLGASVAVSQYFGAGDILKVKRSVSTSLIFMAVVAVALSVAGILLAKPLLVLTNTPDEIISDSAAYLQIIAAGLFFTYLFNAYSAILRGLGNSKTPLVFLIIASLMNVVLDLVFVIKLGLGVPGVAYATIIAQAFSAVMCILYSHKKIDVLRFNKGEFAFDKTLFTPLVRYSLPSAIQQSIVGMGHTAVQGVINTFGANVIAGFGAGVKIDTFAFMPIQNFSSAIATFTGQNIGAGKVDRVKSGLRSARLMMVAYCAALSLVVLFFSGSIIRIFLDYTEVEAISYGAAYLQIIGFTYIIPAILFANSGVFRGTGDMNAVLFTSLISLSLRVLFANVLTLDRFGIGPTGICWGMVVGWGIALVFSILRVRSGKWQQFALVKHDSPPKEVPIDIS